MVLFFHRCIVVTQRIISNSEKVCNLTPIDNLSVIGDRLTNLSAIADRLTLTPQVTMMTATWLTGTFTIEKSSCSYLGAPMASSLVSWILKPL